MTDICHAVEDQTTLEALIVNIGNGIDQCRMFFVDDGCRNGLSAMM
jgi:hypothetical protein